MLIPGAPTHRERLPPPEQQLRWRGASQCKATCVLCNLLLQQLWGRKSQYLENQLLRVTEAKDCPNPYVGAQLHLPVHTAPGLPRITIRFYFSSSEGFFLYHSRHLQVETPTLSTLLLCCRWSLALSPTTSGRWQRMGAKTKLAMLQSCQHLWVTSSHTMTVMTSTGQGSTPVDLSSSTWQECCREG